MDGVRTIFQIGQFLFFLEFVNPSSIRLPSGPSVLTGSHGYGHGPMRGMGSDPGVRRTDPHATNEEEVKKTRWWILLADINFGHDEVLVRFGHV